MSLGVRGGVSEVPHVQWKIPDFFSLDVHWGKYIVSDPFSLAGCTWNLRVYPKGDARHGYLSVYLYREDISDATIKTVTYAIGLKRNDGSLKEIASSPNRTFKAGSSWGWSKFLDLKELQKRKFEVAPSGTLTIMCRIEDEVVNTEEVVANPVKLIPQQMKLVELETLSLDFKHLLSSERKCDVTIIVQGKKFRAHRTVLTARSPVFCAMYEHDTAEEDTGILTIPDCDPNSFREFLSFLYTGRVEEISFWTAYHLYATSDKYDVQQLKLFCSDYLMQNLTVENVCHLFVLADRYCDDELQYSAQDFFNKNVRKIFHTSEWKSLMKNNHRLTDKLLIEMASAICD